MWRHMALGHSPARHTQSLWRGRVNERSNQIWACAPQTRHHKRRGCLGPGVRQIGWLYLNDTTSVLERRASCFTIQVCPSPLPAVVARLGSSAASAHLARPTRLHLKYVSFAPDLPRPPPSLLSALTVRHHCASRRGQVAGGQRPTVVTTVDSPPPLRPRSFCLLVSVVGSTVVGRRPPSGRMRAGSLVGWSGGRAKVGAVHDWMGAWLPYTRTYRLSWRTSVAFLSFLMLAIGATVIGRRPLLQLAQVARSEGMFGGVAGKNAGCCTQLRRAPYTPLTSELP